MSSLELVAIVGIWAVLAFLLAVRSWPEAKILAGQRELAADAGPVPGDARRFDPAA
jgi:hypothetical protein